MANTKVTGDLIASGTITADNLVSGTLDTLLNSYLTTNTYATQSYVTTAVNNLIDAAPASLDTLNELAAALNDDANFATTVTDSIATKLPLAGGTISGNLTVSGSLTGTLATAAQPNITSLGTLSSLAVSGDVTIGSFLSGSDGELLVGQDGSSYYLFAGFGANVSKPIRIGDNPTYISIHTANSEKVRIDSSGNVGIGTSSPSEKIHVYNASGNTFGLIQSASSGVAGLKLQSAVGLSTIYTGVGAAQGFQFYANGSSEAMRITSAGDVLIGKSSASTSGNGIWIIGPGNSSVIFSSMPTSSNTYHVWDTTNSVYRFYVNGQGTVFATNTTISAISDARLKENIQDLTGGLNAVMSLKPRTYDWKEGSGQTGIGVRGFIAQEVEKVFPEYVDEYLTEELPEDGIPYKSVRQDFIPILVKAIQELKDIVDQQQIEIDNLKAQLNG